MHLWHESGLPAWRVTPPKGVAEFLRDDHVKQTKKKPLWSGEVGWEPAELGEAR